MALEIPPGYANWIFTIQNTGGGASANSSISLATSINAALLVADIARISNIFRDSLAPLYDNGWLMGPTHVNFNWATVEYSLDDSGTEAGTHAAAVYASPAVSHVVTKQTGVAGKKQRGRFYLPGVPEADVDEGGVLAGARVNDVTTQCEVLRTALNADAAIDSCVLLHDEETPEPKPIYPLYALACRTVVGTMRPRQRR